MRRPGDSDGGATYAPLALERDEEVLETGAARAHRRSGRVTVALALFVCALVALLIAQHLSGTKRPVVVPAPGPTAAPAPRPFPVPDQGPPPALMLASTLYLVRDGRLIAHRAGTIAETSVTVGDAAETGGSYLLTADRTHSRIWVVKSLPARMLVYAYTLSGLHELRYLNMQGQVAGIDSMKGEFYMSSTAGVVGIADALGSGLLDWTPFRGGRAIAADPTRNRLLLLDDTGPAVRILTASPNLKGSGVSAALPLHTGTFLVVNGRIWAGGSGADGAVLVRLDPRTLRPIRHSEVEGRLGSGTALVAAGSHSFLVRAAAADAKAGAGLWCVDADTGKVLHSWRSVAGPVVIDIGSGAATNPIYSVPSGSTPVRLDAGACRG